MKSTFIVKLVQFILIFFLIIFAVPKDLLAGSCNFYFFDTEAKVIEPNQNMEDEIRIGVTSFDLPAGNYLLQITMPETRALKLADIIKKNITFTVVSDPDEAEKKISRAEFSLSKPDWSKPVWPAEDYTFSIRRGGGATDPESCTTKISIKEEPAQADCKTSISNKEIAPDTGVTLKVEGISEGSYYMAVRTNKLVTRVVMQEETVRDWPDQLISPGSQYVLETYPVGTYYIYIRDKATNRLQCNQACFTVSPFRTGGGGDCTVASAPLPAVCTEEEIKNNTCTLSSGKACGTDKSPAISTAIGCIHTNPSDLALDLLTFGVGIGGGISFLMMLFGAFQMLTSSGNPETLNAGRSRITSAVIGLLFIIFGILFLKIIGVDILKLPGF